MAIALVRSRFCFRFPNFASRLISSKHVPLVLLCRVLVDDLVYSNSKNKAPCM